jgi:acyl carrier protein
VTVVPRLAYAASGKVDGQRRVEPAWSSDGEDGYLPPISPVEKRLAAMWSEALEREQIGLHDTFYGLGGNSIRGLVLLGRMEEAFGVEMPESVLEARSLEAMAAAIEAVIVEAVLLRGIREPASPTGEEEGYLPPASVVEEELAAMWSKLLGRERIGRHDSFFELGGHSLLATQVVKRIEETFGVEVPLYRVFETPTLEAIAAAIEAELLREIEMEREGGIVADGADAHENGSSLMRREKR